MPVNDTDYAANNGVTDNVGLGETILPAGINQGDVYDLLNTYRTNFNAMNAQLDADSGVTDTDYAELHDIAELSTLNVYNQGFDQDSFVALLETIESSFEGVTAKLDADGGVADTDYASTLDYSLDEQVTQIGLSQLGLVNTLETVITQFNALLAKLDADA